MRRVLPQAVLGEIGRLDPAAIAEVSHDAWPDARDAEELHDVLLTLIALPVSGDVLSANDRLRSALNSSLPAWTAYFQQLANDRRAGLARAGDRSYWVAAERQGVFTACFPSAHFERDMPFLDAPQVSREDAVLALVTGWMACSGPFTTHQLARVLDVPAPDIEKALLRLESRGVVLRGNFTDALSVESPDGQTALLSTEWCERRLLARIHRLTLGRLRKEIQSVTPAQFMDWLLAWQHVAPGTQLLGERGTLEAIRQMQGFEAPANAWERHILQRRIASFDPRALDSLCLTGAVGWGRLSPHPATLEAVADSKRRVIPTSVAPITFFVREDSDWMVPRREPADSLPRGLSPDATAVFEFLRQRGASFFADIVRATGKLKAEVETALWELVAAGLITADGFDNLRALIDLKRRSGQGSGKTARPRHSAGRWSLLYSNESQDRGKALEATCWMLLHRYGIVFRELLSRETILPKWRELLITLRRLEDRGEIRGGRFVSGFLGEQFALPLAVESLRAKRKQPSSGETTTITAADPLNLVGIIVPGERVPANSGRTVAFREGVAIAADEGALPRNIVPMPLAR
jgi:ATP-dependent Lhr-like helicase